MRPATAPRETPVHFQVSHRAACGVALIRHAGLVQYTRTTGEVTCKRCRATTTVQRVGHTPRHEERTTTGGRAQAATWNANATEGTTHHD